MQFIRSAFNIFLMAIGGLLGNLISGWIQQDLWNGKFGHIQLVATIGGMLLVLFVLSLMDMLSSDNRGDANNPGIYGNIQLGSALIRVLRGTNVAYNLQIGRAKIEVLDTTKADQKLDSRD
jgi:hypothetical protein